MCSLKCRLCLVPTKSKNLQSIFQYVNKNKYSELVTAVANVKIYEGDGLPDKMCHTCRRKLKELYDFKIMIESSDTKLRLQETNISKVQFNNIEDVKLQLGIIKAEVEFDVTKPLVEFDFENNDQILYNDTNIKKITETENKCGQKPISVLEFLEAINDEDDGMDDENDNYVYDGNYISDVDYNQYSPQSDSNFEFYTRTLRSKKIKSKIEKKKKRPKKRIIERMIKPAQVLKPSKISHVYVGFSFGPKIKGRKQINVNHQMCDICGNVFANLKAHLLQHHGEKKYECDMCSRKYFTLSALAKHIQGHSKERNFICEKCNASFRCLRGLNSHMLKHNGERKFVCEICNKSFLRKKAMQRHKTRHNVVNKTVKCEQCPMTFYDKFGLTHHMRIHTGERPYKCELCSQPYSYKHDFNRHCLKKHGVFFNRRSIYLMNNEVLKKERELMKDILLNVHGIVKDGPINPFEGPQANQAYEQLVKALKNGQVPIAAGLELVTVSPGNVALIDNSPL